MTTSNQHDPAKGEAGTTYPPLRRINFLIGNWPEGGAESRGIVASVGQDANLSTEQHIANADRIVLCWNSHDNLVDLCERALVMATDLYEFLKLSVPDKEVAESDFMRELRAALAEVEKAEHQ